jgi:ribonuclease-3
VSAAPASKTTLNGLLEKLGITCSQPDLLQRALTHRSHGINHNERLEFLGDAVLNSMIADLLYHRHPLAQEGELSRWRARLVCQAALADQATTLGLGDYLRLGSGERKSGGHARPSILADAFEAIIGAVYLDQGPLITRALIDRLFQPWLASSSAQATQRDAKTRLQEWLQAHRQALPIYTVSATSGQPHAQHFEVSCAVGERLFRGQGSNRRSAEQEAAQAALSALEYPSAHHC